MIFGFAILQRQQARAATCTKNPGAAPSGAPGARRPSHPTAQGRIRQPRPTPTPNSNANQALSPPAAASLKRTKAQTAADWAFARHRVSKEGTRHATRKWQSALLRRGMHQRRALTFRMVLSEAGRANLQRTWLASSANHRTRHERTAPTAKRVTSRWEPAEPSAPSSPQPAWRWRRPGTRPRRRSSACSRPACARRIRGDAG